MAAIGRSVMAPEPRREVDVARVSRLVALASALRSHRHRSRHRLLPQAPQADAVVNWSALDDGRRRPVWLSVRASAGNDDVDAPNAQTMLAQAESSRPLRLPVAAWSGAAGWWLSECVPGLTKWPGPEPENDCHWFEAAPAANQTSPSGSSSACGRSVERLSLSELLPRPCSFRVGLVRMHERVT